MHKTPTVLFKALAESHPDDKVSVSIISHEYVDSLVLNIGGEEHTILESVRDQWGTWYYGNGYTIAQEDDTKSVVDALIEGLLFMRNRTEMTMNCEVVYKESEE